MNREEFNGREQLAVAQALGLLELLVAWGYVPEHLRASAQEIVDSRPKREDLNKPAEAAEAALRG